MEDNMAAARLPGEGLSVGRERRIEGYCRALA